MNGWSRSSLDPSSSVRGLGVGAGDQDPGDAHDVELQPRGVQPLDLLVARDKHLAAWWPHFFAPGFWSSM